MVYYMIVVWGREQLGKPLRGHSACAQLRERVVHKAALVRTVAHGMPATTTLIITYSLTDSELKFHQGVNLSFLPFFGAKEQAAHKGTMSKKSQKTCFLD